jgi:hypothetical protein
MLQAAALRQAIKTTQIIKVNTKHKPAVWKRNDLPSKFQLVFIPLHCTLVLQQEGTMILKTTGTIHPATQHNKARINCAFVGLSIYLRQVLMTQSKSAVYVKVLYQYYLNVLHGTINMKV